MASHELEAALSLFLKDHILKVYDDILSQSLTAMDLYSHVTNFRHNLDINSDTFTRLFPDLEAFMVPGLDDRHNRFMAKE